MSEAIEMTSAERNPASSITNVFQYMMNSRHKVIGSNFSGKECKDIDIKSDSNQEKLSERRALFEDWAEKKGGEKRKMMNDIAEKHIHKVLENRKKRMKKMLKLEHKGSKNSGIENFDDDDVVVEKKAKNVKVLSDSDSSCNADDIKCTKQKKKSNLYKKRLENDVKIEIKEKENIESVETNVSLKETKTSLPTEHIKTLKYLHLGKDEIFNGDLSDEEIFPTKSKEKTVNCNNKELKEECFNPRTWRMKVKLHENLNIEDEAFSEDNESKEIINPSNGPKKEIKLAPIFTKELQKKMNKEALIAKNNFLFSGVPSHVRKIMTKTKSFQELNYNLDIFPKIGHVQQKTVHEFWHLSETKLNFAEQNGNDNKLLYNKITLGTLTNCKTKMTNSTIQFQSAAPKKLRNLKNIVKNVKQSYPDYPVYKSFRILFQRCENNVEKCEIKVENGLNTPKRKRGRPKKKDVHQKPTANVSQGQANEFLMWTEKYRPKSEEEVVGNTKAVHELKQWLESWVSYRSSNKRKRSNSNSSDDFYSDGNTKDSDTFLQNVILLIGPLGSGKTSSVYALCNELNLDVFEINASCKRPGKKILADHQKGIQSCYVKNTNGKIENESKSDLNKKLSVLLVEDVDIVFEDQDEGFIAAITTLALFSKRPIILTSTDKKCPHLQKLIQQYTVLNFSSLSKHILSPWLQILCLVEGLKVNKDLIDKLVNFFKGDLRKIMLQLQFWVQTGGDIQLNVCEKDNSIKYTQIFEKNEEISDPDDNSNLSWLKEVENCEENNNDNIYHENCQELFTSYYKRNENEYNLVYPVNLNTLRWMMPDIFTEKSATIEEETNSCKNSQELENIIDLVENLAIADTIYTKLKLETYEEPIIKYWQTNLTSSLSLIENFTMFAETSETSLEIIHFLVETKLKHHIQENNINLKTFSSNMNELSTTANKHEAMKSLLSVVPTICILDRRAICEDYQTMIRKISRTESQKLNTSSKRKNRFYHYLRNFNIYLNESTNLMLCNAFSTNCVE